MPRRKRSEDIVSRIEGSLAGQEEVPQKAPVVVSESAVPAEQIALIVERIVAQGDVDNDVLMRSVDEGLLLAAEKMKSVLADSKDPEEQGNAARVLTGISNNLLARVRLKMSRKQRVHVTIGENVKVGKSSQTRIGARDES